MLFGHQSDDSSQATPVTAGMQSAPVPGVNPLAVDSATGASLPTVLPGSQPQPTGLEEPSVLNQPSSTDVATAGTAPLATALPLPPAPEPAETEVPEPTAPEPTPVEPPQPPANPVVPATPEVEATPADLLAIKQQALEQLSPLVDQLEQTPEERFRTTMMLIQSTDDPSRLQEAYEAAGAISDEKARAQALLDVINEINYFTQKSGN